MASSGETVTFECMPYAWPEPHFQWRRNGRLIDASPTSNSGTGNGNRNKFTVQRIAQADAISAAGQAQQQQANSIAELIGSQLVITNVDKNDAGQYSCLVETKGSHRLIERESPVGHLSVLGEYHNWTLLVLSMLTHRMPRY